MRRSESDPSPAPWMDRSLSFNESLYILQENFFVTGDGRKNLSENYLTDISFYGTINNVIWRNACDGKNMAGVVKWLTRRIVAPLRVGSSPTTRPIFFLLEIRYCRTSWGHRQAVRQRTLTPLSVVRLYLPLPGNRNEPEDLFAKKISSGSFFYAFHIEGFLYKK